MTSEERREKRYKRRKAEREAKKQKLSKCNDYEWIFKFDHLYSAYRKSRKNVAWKASVQRFITNAMLNIYNIWNALMNRKYHMRPMHSFDLMERGKPRHIQSVCIRDRIVQRCLCDYSLVPLLSRSFIYDNSACMKNKGYHFAMQRITKHLRRYYRKHGNKGYILLFDFRKYFESIPHEVSKEIVRTVITDPGLLNIADQIIDRFEGEQGLGLGSQVSQIIALAVSSKLDHYIKDVCGIEFYGRYNDDGYIIHESKEYLLSLKEKIREICRENGVELNEKKTQIIKLSHGFTWLKVKINLTDSGKILRRLSPPCITKERRKLKKMKRIMREGKISRQDVYQSFQSWRAYARNMNSWKSVQSVTKLYNELYVYDREDDEEVKTTVQLESKDVREIIAKFLCIPTEDVIPNRYNFGIANMSAEEIERKIKGNWKGE